MCCVNRLLLSGPLSAPPAMAASGSIPPLQEALPGEEEPFPVDDIMGIFTEEAATAYGLPQIQYQRSEGLHTQFTSGVYTMSGNRCDELGFVDSKLIMVGFSFPKGTTVDAAGKRVSAALRRTGIPQASLQDVYITRQPGKGTKQAGSCAIIRFSKSVTAAELLAGVVKPILPVVGDKGETVQGVPLLLKYPGDSTVSKADRKACRVEVHSDVFRGLDANQVNYIILAAGMQLAEKEGAAAAMGLQFYPGSTSKALTAETAVIVAVNPFSASLLPTTQWGAAAGGLGPGHLQADLPMSLGRATLRFTKVQGVQVAGCQVILPASYLGVYLAALRSCSVYRLGSRIPTAQEIAALQSDITAYVKQPLPQPAVQVVPLKHTAGTAAHLLVNVPSKSWMKKLVEQGVVLPNRGGIYIRFEEPKMARKK